MTASRRQPDVSAEQLMAQYQLDQGAAAFDSLFSMYFRPAVAVARQILRDSALAEDAVQETFIRVARGCQQYSPSKPFSNWFYAILRNACTDTLRKDRRYGRAIQELFHLRRSRPETVSSVPPELDCLQRLPQAEREVLVLHIVEEMQFDEVAAAMGISKEAAKKRAQRGLRRLRERMQDSQVGREEECAKRVPPAEERAV